MNKKDARISLQRLMFKTFKELECPKHIVGKVTYNEKGNAYSKCRICDDALTLVGKTLGDVDKMSLDMLNALLPKGAEKYPTRKT